MSGIGTLCPSLCTPGLSEFFETRHSEVFNAARTHTLEEVALQVDDVYVAQLNPHSDIPTAPE